MGFFRRCKFRVQVQVLVAKIMMSVSIIIIYYIILCSSKFILIGIRICGWVSLAIQKGFFSALRVYNLQVKLKPRSYASWIHFWQPVCSYLSRSCVYISELWPGGNITGHFHQLKFIFASSLLFCKIKCAFFLLLEEKKKFSLQPSSYRREK